MVDLPERPPLFCVQKVCEENLAGRVPHWNQGHPEKYVSWAAKDCQVLFWERGPSVSPMCFVFFHYGMFVPFLPGGEKANG